VRRRRSGGGTGDRRPHSLGQLRRRRRAPADVADHGDAGERLQAESAEDQHDQPEPEHGDRRAPGDGQAPPPPTAWIGEDLVAQNAGWLGIWHAQLKTLCYENARERRRLVVAVPIDVLRGDR
jgi:hypothetical protein